MVKLFQFLSCRISIHGCSIKMYDMKMTLWHGPILEASIWTKKSNTFKVKKWHFRKNTQISTHFCEKVYDGAVQQGWDPYIDRKALQFRTFFVLVMFLALLSVSWYQPKTVRFWPKFSPFLFNIWGQWFESRGNGQIFSSISCSKPTELPLNRPNMTRPEDLLQEIEISYIEWRFQ